MSVNYHVTGAGRKRLVSAIEAMTGQRAQYQGMPTAAYRVAGFEIDRAGALSALTPQVLLRNLHGNSAWCSGHEKTREAEVNG